MERRSISGMGFNKGLGKGFVGVVGHSVSSSSSVNSRRGGGFLLSNVNAGRSQGLPAAPQFFSAVPLKHTLPQHTSSQVTTGGGDSILKDEKIRALEAKVKFLKNEIYAGNLSQQLSNMSEQLTEARRALKIKEEKLATTTKEKDALRDIFFELREEFRDTQARLQSLQETTRSERPTKAKKSHKSARRDNEVNERRQSNKADPSDNKIKLLELRIAELEKDILSYQSNFLENLLGPSSSKHLISLTKNQGDRDKMKVQSMNSSSTDMHSFLRETIQKLKEDLNSINEERNCLRSESEGKAIEFLRIEKELKDAQEDLKRVNSSLVRLEDQNRVLTEERDSIRSHFQDAIVPHLNAQIDILKKSVDSLEHELDATKKEFTEERERLERDIVIEREKADLLLAQGIEEREGSEAKWRDRWEEHTSRMKDEMLALRKEFEEPLRTAHVREERLRVALEEIEERYERSKTAWEVYRRDLYDQVTEWKNRFSEKLDLADSLQAGKIELEALLQKKLEEIADFQEMVRTGLEERQNLEKRVSDLEDHLRNKTADSPASHSCYSTKTTNSATDTSVLRMSLGVSEHDLAALQAKMIQDAHEIAASQSKAQSPPSFPYPFPQPQQQKPSADSSSYQSQHYLPYLRTPPSPSHSQYSGPPSTANTFPSYSNFNTNSNHLKNRVDSFPYNNSRSLCSPTTSNFSTNSTAAHHRHSRTSSLRSTNNNMTSFTSDLLSPPLDNVFTVAAGGSPGTLGTRHRPMKSNTRHLHLHNNPKPKSQSQMRLPKKMITKAEPPPAESKVKVTRTTRRHP